MWIFIIGCASEPPQPLQIDTRPRVQISQSTSADAPIENRYNCMLQAHRDVMVSGAIGGRIQRIHTTEGTELMAQKSVISLERERPRAQLSLAEAGLQDAQAMLDDAQANLRRLEALDGSTAAADLERAQIAERRAEAGVQAAQAQQQLALVQLAEHQIKTPFSGEVVEIFHEIGALLPAGQPAFRIVDSSILSTSIGIGASERLSMTLGIPEAEIIIGDHIYRANIDASPIAADLGGLSWNIDLSITRPENVLPGSAATAVLRTSPPKADARIPIETLDMNGRVLGISTEGTLEPHTIDIVAEHGPFIYVNGVSPDTPLVLYPSTDWNSETTVVILESTP